MSDKRYQVVFTGELASDKDVASVTSNLILDIGLSEEKVELLLNGSRRVLKRLNTVGKAQRLTKQLEHAGILCVIEDLGPEPGSEEAGESSLITFIKLFKPKKRGRRTAASRSDTA